MSPAVQSSLPAATSAPTSGGVVPPTRQGAAVAIPTDEAGLTFVGVSKAPGTETETLSWWRRTAGCSGDNLPTLSAGQFFLFKTPTGSLVNGFVMPIPSALVQTVQDAIASCAASATVPVSSGAVGGTPYFAASADYIGNIAVVNGTLVTETHQPKDAAAGMDLFRRIVAAAS